MWDTYHLTSEQLHLAEQETEVSDLLARSTFFLLAFTTAGKEGSVVNI